ncbi:MAG TPA: S9 family peptidase [Gemmatimonadaceae bacterium]|nr:S9 family peptidase [Gemmatimonadaceae bacterium]
MFSTSRSLVCILGLLVAAPVMPLAAQGPARRPLEPGDLYRLRSVRDPQISPDGQWVAYTVSVLDSAKDKSNSDIWMASWDGSQNIQLTHDPDGESSARWSPDGKYLSFLSSRRDPKHDSELWLLDRRGGEAQRVTNIKGDIDDYVWAPDAHRILFVIRDPDPREDSAHGDSAKPAQPHPIVIDRYHFKSDQQGYLENRHTHLYIFDLATRKLEQLTSGAFDDEDPAWSPDGTRIAFVSHREGADPDRNDNTDIYVMQARAGAPARQLNSWRGEDSGPLSWSPDGKWVAYLQGSETRFSAYNQDVLAIVPAAGGAARLLTDSLDRTVSDPRFSPDGAWVYVLVTDDRMRYLARVRVADGHLEKLAPGKRVVRSVTMASNGHMAAAMTTPDQPVEIYALEGNDVRRLSHQNDTFMTHIALGAVDGVSYTTKDGNEVHGVLYLPVGYQKGTRYPTLLRIHGGPNGQDGYEFNMERQLFAGAGYAVLSVNYRGSAGRGRAWKESIYADWGDKEVVDLLAGATYVVKSGVADGDHMGIGGWSYGCILTDYTMATDQRFKGATCGAGSALQLAMYGVDQYIAQYDQELGPPWKSEKLWLKLSYPFFHADRIKTPTLFLGGTIDFNVPLVGGEQMYQALRSLGVPTELIVYPNQHHGIARPSFQRDRFERYLAWYAKYVKGAGQPATMGAKQ